MSAIWRCQATSHGKQCRSTYRGKVAHPWYCVMHRTDFTSRMTYDGLTAEQCLDCYSAYLRGDQIITKLSSWMSPTQLTAARNLWSTQLRAKVKESSKPKLTISYCELDADD